MYCLKFHCFGRKDKLDLNNPKVMLQFCRKRLKTEQNCRALSLILVQNYMWNLSKILPKFGIIIKILVLVSSSILTLNIRS